MLKLIYEDLVKGNVDTFGENIKKTLSDGAKAGDILNQAMVPAMEEVGRLFQRGDYFAPEMLLAAHTMKSGLKTLRPHLSQANIKPIGRALIGTVKGDLHDIGKNLVAMMMEGVGLEAIDLGVDVDAATFVSAVQEHKPQFLGLSALLTTTMPEMENVITALKETGIRDKVKAVVGGTPINQEYADQIGAELFASNAAEATKVTKAAIFENA